MRINQFIAQSTGMSRRKADQAVAGGQVTINGRVCNIGETVNMSDIVCLNGVRVKNKVEFVYLMLNKPVGYVCSRSGQGSKTIYDLIPYKYHNLKPVGRLDKDSSGLLMITNDGSMANKLTHPSYKKEKVYKVEINKPLTDIDFVKISKIGVNIGEKSISKFQLKKLVISNQPMASRRKKIIPNSCFMVTLTEGKNRQIRRTFAALGYNVTKLHRTKFGPYQLGSLASGKHKTL